MKIIASKKGDKKMMKKTRKIAVVVILMVMLVSWGTAFAFQNEPEGFRGLKWGDPVKAGTYYAYDSDGLWLYQMPNDKMWLGEVSLSSIFYGFWDSKFVSVSLYFDGKENYDLLETICEGKFGEGIVLEFYGVSWHGTTAMMVLTYDAIEEEGFLGMSGTTLYLEYLEARDRQRVEKAEEDW